MKNRVGNTKIRYSNGFTIVELLIVVVVIAILAAITIVSYNGIQSRAQTSSIANDLKQNTKTIMSASVEPSSYLPASVKTSGLDVLKLDMSKYKVVTYCATATNFVLLFELTSGKKYYQKNGEAMVNDDTIDSFQPCPTAGISSAYTTYLNLPSVCSLENANCTFSGTATVVYGSAAQGRFNRLTNRTSPVACSNATFTDPASGFPKACYVYPN